MPIPRPPLSLSLAGLAPDEAAPWSGSPRRAIEWAAGLGCRAVRLDASILRARELDRSARRDLASLLHRLSLACAGLDLWVPALHFADPARSERAADAVAGAAELAADLRALLGAGPAMTVAVTFPIQGADTAIRGIAERAARCGSIIADHAFPLGNLTIELSTQPGSAVAPGVDPAAILMGGGDPAAEASRAGRALAAARLNDASSQGRVAFATGRLDELAYLVALQTAGYARDAALDLRALPDQDRVARDVLDRWTRPAA